MRRLSCLAVVLATAVVGCSETGGGSPGPTPSATQGSTQGSSQGSTQGSGAASPEVPLEETDVPFTESESPVPDTSDVPATMYAVLADRLDPRQERLAAYDGTNEPASGVGAGTVRGGWSMNAEWSPRGLVGLVVADSWPDGWLCVDAYPGCRSVPVPGVEGATAQALATGRTQISVGFEQPGGQKVIVSAVDIAELSAADLAAAAADERLDLP
ncbi:hypothetical protein KLP28_15475 [Nocardioidaceae bacterium]|nr:hypothetical protein KLP28_15475 [Nocardioidaceae bacterium]